MTTERGYKNSYDIYQCDDEFNYNACDTYTENNLLFLLKGDYDYYYSHAPEAKTKKDLLDFFIFDTDSMGIMFFHTILIMYILRNCDHFLVPFLGDNDDSVLISIIVVLSIYYLVFKKLKSFTERYIGEESIIEAYNTAEISNKNSLDIRKIKADLSRSALKIGITFLASGIAFISLNIMLELALFVSLIGAWMLFRAILKGRAHQS